MGCLMDKLTGSNDMNRLDEASDSNEPKKEYSWDKKRTTRNVQDFILDGLSDQVVGRMPGSVNGEQFIIQNCENCDIYVFDHSATVSVDDCNNCRIFLGPIKTSIFIRDCNNCVVVTACQQFRTRDCKKLDAFLCCVTQPIIESSTGVRFGCFQFSYLGLREQFTAAGIRFYNNNWNSIHDFTPVPGENNHGLIPKEKPLTDYLPLPTELPYSSLGASTDSSASVVPYTLGSKYAPPGDVVLVVVFPSETQNNVVRELLDALKDVSLVQTAEMALSPGEAKKVFNSDKFAPLLSAGNSVLLQYAGSEALHECHNRVQIITGRDKRVTIHVSSDAQSGAREVDDFNGLSQMQMAV